MQTLFHKHKTLLEQAQKSIHSRQNWSAFPEIPSERIYGEGEKNKAEIDFNELLNKEFVITNLTTTKNIAIAIAREYSPYGFALGISYPTLTSAELTTNAKNAQANWSNVDIETRIGICLEMLTRLSKSSFLIANCVMHTTGQPYVMAFQAGGPHALDRGLEAITYAYNALTANVNNSVWQKTVGKNKQNEPIIAKINKQYIAKGLGVGVVIGCATFPTWNSYPGIFANLATGNSVIIKPSEKAILPLAIASNIMREVLIEYGFDADIVQLAVPQNRNATQSLLLAPEITMIDYTGGNEFANWLTTNCFDKQLYLEKSGINCAIMHSTNNYQAMLDNLAFSISLYSEQMCTSIQNIYISKTGIHSELGHKSFAEISTDLANALTQLLAEQARCEAILGAIHDNKIKELIEQTTKEVANNPQQKVICPSKSYSHSKYADALTATPLIIATNQNDDATQHEKFGPIVFLIACDDAPTALQCACSTMRSKGALTASLYCVDNEFKNLASKQIIAVGVPLSINFTDSIYVNQSAAFSDFHGNSLTPAANTSLCDLAFVAKRFGWITIRDMS